MINIKAIREFVSKDENIIRVTPHIFLIVLTWIIGKYVAVGPYLKNDSNIISDAFCLLFFFQTILIYYFFSEIIFPNYLYKKRVFFFLFYTLLSFLVIYWSNYLAIIKLLPYSDAFKPNGSKEVWIVKINDLLIANAGWLGCFKSIRIAYWNYGFSFEIAAVYLTVKAFRDILSIQKRNLTLERDNLALELDFLKSQINPHFLFNTLNSIYARTVDVDENASGLVLKLADLMRYSLYGANEEKVPLSEELEYIQNYLDLEKYRHSEELVNISFAMDGTTTGYKIAPLLLISFVENAFKHGVNLSRKSSYVYVSAVIEDGILYFTVQNSLPEQLKNTAGNSSAKKSGGIGLVNTHKRLNLLYPDLYKLTSHKTEDEYEVMISIKLDVA